MERAIEAAGDDTVTIAGGASAVRQGFEAGVIDEIMLNHSPVVLGGGESPSPASTACGCARRGALVAERDALIYSTRGSETRVTWPNLGERPRRPAATADHRPSVRA